MLRRWIGLVAALVLALSAASALAGETLDPVKWDALKKRVEELMKVPARAGDKEAAARELGDDDSVRAAQLMVRWMLASAKAQETEYADEIARRDEELAKLEKLLLKAYTSLPPTQAEHLKAWQTAKQLSATAHEADDAEVHAQAALTAAMQRTVDPAAVMWVSLDGVKATRGVKYGAGAYLAVVKCVLKSCNEIKPGPALEWARPGNPREIRVLALGWIADNDADTGFGTAVEALADKEVLIRRAGVAALVAIGDPRAVKPMIDALNSSGGLLADELDAALFTFTGKTFEGDGKIWLRWWGDEGQKWLAQAVKERFDRAERKSGGAASFYGIQTKSERIVFVLDRSGSMKEPAGQASQKPKGPVTGGGKDDLPPVTGETKLDVAKAQLARSIDGLPPAVVFNVVFYGTDVQIWKAPPQLVPARPFEKDAAKKWFEALKPEGATNLFGALRKALEYAVSDGKGGGAADTIFLLSDGVPTLAAGAKGDMRGDEIDREIDAFLEANRSARCVVHTIGVGPGHDAGLMRRLADLTGGTYIAVGVE